MMRLSDEMFPFYRCNGEKKGLIFMKYMFHLFSKVATQASVRLCVGFTEMSENSIEKFEI